jgi:hypothetical protein
LTGAELLTLFASRAHELSHALRRPYRIATFGAEVELCLCHQPQLSFERAAAASTKPPNALACFAVMGEQDVDNGKGFAATAHTVHPHSHRILCPLSLTALHSVCCSFAEAVQSCRERGLRIQSTTWAGDHAMPPAGELCYAAMVAFLFERAEEASTQPSTKQLPPEHLEQQQTPAAASGAAEPEDDDLAALGF